MVDPETLLLPIFHDLRRQGFPLGVGEYLFALETIATEEDPFDTNLIWWICRLLWAKSKEDQQVFDAVFRRHVNAPVATLPAVTPPSSTTTSTRAPPIADKPATDRPGEETPIDDESADDAGLGEAVAPSLALAGWWLRPGLWQPAGTRTPYQFTPRLPLAQREMSGIWRHLRRLQREGPLEDLDVEGTIDRISRTGMFLGPVLQPRRRNQVRLVLLVDCDEAMAAFAPVVAALIESILRGGLLGQTATYYFQTFPEETLYERDSLQGPHPTAAVLAEQARDSSVLFISDAGAAKGRFESTRVEGITRFLASLREYTYRYAWLNPVPKHRWPATTAAAVARKAPMFPLNREGLIDTVNILRGHPFPAGVG